MKKGWLVGTGFIGIEHGKVLNDLDVEYLAIGRGEASANNFKNEVGKEVVTGGLDRFLDGKPEVPDFVVNGVPVDQLKNSILRLIEFGVKNILLEKPGGVNRAEIEEIATAAAKNDVTIYLGYNRRFYASVMAAEEIIQKEGGVTSFNFEFTEWAHVIGELEIPKIVKENWFLANSTHVVDMAFSLAGNWPEQMACMSTGKLDWHPKASNFSGSGRTKGGALFSYHANWDAPGRWGIEIMTKGKKLVYRPLERLKLIDKGTVREYEAEVDYSLDEKYKAGLYLQMKDFLAGKKDRFCMIDDLVNHLGVYESILSGENYHI